MSNKLLHPITLIGPLNLELNFRVKNAPRMLSDTEICRNLGTHYGGTLLKQLRILQSIGYSSNIIAYVGNDEIGEKIINNLKTENISHSIQKIPGVQTGVSCNFFDNHSNSNLCTSIKNLSLWNIRQKTVVLSNPTVIYLHPIIPSNIQIEIIKKYHKTSKIVLQPPLDGNLEIFQTAPNLHIILNEYNAFQFFLLTNYTFFEGQTPLKLPFLENHKVIIEVHKKLFTKDEFGKPIFVDFEKSNLKNDGINDFFIAGMLAALCSKQNFRTASLWGLNASIKKQKNQKISANEIAMEINQFTWKDVLE